MNPLLLFLLLPLVEIAVFIQVGSWIGVLPTIGLILLAGLAGTVLLRRQGLAVLREAQACTDRGELPVDAVFRGFCIVAGSILLIIPGFVTDLLGILLFVPPLRAALGRWMLERMRGRGDLRVWTNGRETDPRRPSPGRVIDVEYEEVHPRDGNDGAAPRLEESRWRPARDDSDRRG
ncbi:FxsA family protein [Azospirillum sp. ST 5-10]|uniref:FxsA family protein n=1 Tax=unclassified Azospirillum TaxID=2630922 RepID=UPI003F4A6780